MANFLYVGANHLKKTAMVSSVFNKKNLLPVILSASVLFGFQSCKKYEDGPGLSLRTKTNRLTGTWNVEEINGYPLSSDGSISIITFGEDREFSMLSSFNDGFGNFSTYREVGDWEWENRKEEVEVEGTTFKEDWEILRLTNTELWFEVENSQVWKCEKNN